MDEEMVLCAASSYEQKYYLNPEFESLPEAVKQELQIMCVCIQRMLEEFSCWCLMRMETLS